MIEGFCNVSPVAEIKSVDDWIIRLICKYKEVNGRAFGSTKYICRISFGLDLLE